MRNETEYAAGAGYPEPRDGESVADAPPADPELVNAAEADAAAPDDADAEAYPVTGADAPPVEQERLLSDDDVISGGVVAEEPGAHPTVDGEPVVLDAGLPADDEEAQGAADDEEARARADTAGTEDAGTDLSDSDLTEAELADTDLTDSADEAIVADDGEDEDDEYDRALDAEPVAGTDPDSTDDTETSDGTETTDDGGVPAGVEYAVAEDEQPVVDSFVDESRGADPYGIPEPALAPPPAFGAEPVLPGAVGYPTDEQTHQVTEEAPLTDDSDEEVVAYGEAEPPADVEADAADSTFGTETAALAAGAAGAGVVAAGYAGSQQEQPPAAEAADEAPAGEPAGMMPGDADADLTPMAVVIGAADGDRLRERWQQLQLRFIDNPRSTAELAQTLVGEVVDTLTAALNSQRDQLDDWKDTQGDDTEVFRAAVMRYRDFFDRLLSL